ncbi:MAG: translation initiation factor IF-2 [Rikenellaceae bacterium]
MSNEKRLRLVQVAKEFKVGINTITDFLRKNGIKSDGSPNSIVEPSVYATLEKEYGANRGGSNDRNSVRERISKKQASVSIESDAPEAAAATTENTEVMIKSNIVEKKPQVTQPQVLGSINLDAKYTQKQGPKSHKQKGDHGQKAKAVVPTPAPTPAPAPAPKMEEKAPVVEVVAPVVEAPVTAPVAAEEKTSSNMQTIGIPQVLGTIDVSGFAAGGKGKHKRKRLSKEKVDINRVQNNKQAGGGTQGQGGAQRNNNQGGGAQGGGNGQGGNRNNHNGGGQRQGGGNQNAAAPGQGRRNKGAKAAPKPVVRPEVSDEEVSKKVKDTLARLTAKGVKNKGAKYRKEKRDAQAERAHEEFEREEMERSTLKVTEFVTVSELATMMNVTVTEVISACMNLGLMVSINQRLDAEALVVVAEEFDYKVEFVSVEIQEAIADEDNEEEADNVPRPPIVTVMGHVDHGKTSLLDNIRKTNVIQGEAGGITQHIGAYSVELNGQKITFLDTPGHEAFTAMRARGAKVTDVAIIIVAADDSVMPQTTEAINHAQAAGVPMVFAINKCDKPAANPDHIKEQLAQMNYLVEDWGGKYQSQDVSAKMGMNLDKLLTKVLLEAELLELKANPDKKASGTVIESTLDKGRGYVSTILVQNGTLRVGDILLSGIYTGRVKAMFNENGVKIDAAGPSTPVQVLGLNGAPQAGDTFNVMEDDRSAREVANKREQLQRMQGLMTQKHVTLDEIGRRIAIGSFKELNIIVKGDVDGSIEAMSGSLIKLSKETVQVNVIHAAVGQISESDVLLAAASNAIIVGFQVRPSASARKLAEKEEIEIRLYSIIYDAINDIKDAIEGMLEPIMKEEIVCSIEVLEVFKVSKVGTIAGGLVREGKISRNTPIRVIRDGIVIYTGKLGSLKRYKDDVKEVTNGMDCGLNIESFNDIKIGDIIEGYEQVEVKRK